MLEKYIFSASFYHTYLYSYETIHFLFMVGSLPTTFPTRDEKVDWPHVSSISIKHKKIKIGTCSYTLLRLERWDLTRQKVTRTIEVFCSLRSHYILVLPSPFLTSAYATILKVLVTGTLSSPWRPFSQKAWQVMDQSSPSVKSVGL